MRSPPAKYQQPDSTTSSMGATNSNAPLHASPQQRVDLSPRPLPQPQPRPSPTPSPRKPGSVKSSRGPGIVGKPLIFAAMASVDQPAPQPQQQTPHLHTRVQQPEATQPPLDKRVPLIGMNEGHQIKTAPLKMNRDGNMRTLPPPPPQYAYPSPPAEVNDNGRLPVRRESLSVQRNGVLNGNGSTQSFNAQGAPPTGANGHMHVQGVLVANGNTNGYPHQAYQQPQQPQQPLQPHRHQPLPQQHQPHLPSPPIPRSPAKSSRPGTGTQTQQPPTPTLFNAAVASHVPRRPSTSNGNGIRSSVVVHGAPLRGSPVKGMVGKVVQLEVDDVHVLGVPLDEDPFAKMEGVRMLPGSGTGSGAGSRSASPPSESVWRSKSREGREWKVGRGPNRGGRRCYEAQVKRDDAVASYC